MKKAFITGIAGQNGSYMAELLLSKGYSVFGLIRSGSNQDYIPSGVQLVPGDLIDADSIRSAVRSIQPDEIYNFGGITDLKTAYADPEQTWAINHLAVKTLLDAGLETNPNLRFLQASSSEVFLPSDSIINEHSPRDWETANPYAKAKLLADRDIVSKTKNDRGAFCCSAFLFNHESPRKSDKSVLKKISRTLVKIHLGLESTLSLGNLEARRDWSFAKDSVEAMWRMLQHDRPEDFVVTSGTSHSVKDAIDMAAQILEMELEWEGAGIDMKARDRKTGRIFVTVDPEFYRPTEAHPKVGDTTKAQTLLHWRPKLDLQGLMELMVQTDLNALQANPTSPTSS